MFYPLLTSAISYICRMDNVMLYTEQKWKQLTAFSKKEELKDKLWSEIVELYNGPYRFYHNLAHVASLFKWSEQYVDKLRSPLAVGFAILYHDIVYDTFKSNNEEESAAKAVEHLTELNVKRSIIEEVEAYILATKGHELLEADGNSNDISYFLDFDLSMLGSSWDEYEQYSHQIRKEYRQYPDAVYLPGRKNALKQLSDKDTLYFTADFRENLEPAARQNIFREMQLLT